jgi:molybdopterin molybdotransferase
MLVVKTPEEALGLIRSQFRNLTPLETVPVADCVGRVLAEDILAKEYVPGFDRSTVDGYAVRAADTFGCSDAIPALLPMAGEIRMGRPPEAPLAPGSCMAIPTGGALPQGADAAVMVEYTEDYGDGTVGICKPASPGMNLIYKGDDVFPGKTVLSAGRKLTVSDVGALAAMGIEAAPVRKPPLVGVLSTGDELVPAGETPGAGQVRDVNGPLLAALCRQAGAEIRRCGIVPDDPALLEQAVKQGVAECDMLLISGGSSVGAKDATARILEAQGEVLFHGIAVKPGKPTILGKVGEVPVFGLPGHPAAAFFIAWIFVRAAIAALTGRAPEPRSTPALLAEPVSANHGRAELLAVRLFREEGRLWARPVRTKSGLISSLAGSDGYLMISRDCEGLAQGAQVDVFFYSED